MSRLSAGRPGAPRPFDRGAKPDSGQAARRILMTIGSGTKSRIALAAAWPFAAGAQQPRKIAHRISRCTQPRALLLALPALAGPTPNAGQSDCVRDFANDCCVP